MRRSCRSLISGEIRVRSWSSVLVCPAWRAGRERPRRSQDRSLSVRIKAIHATSRQTYGSPRIHQELKANGVQVRKKRVERLMKAAGVAVLPLRRFVTTTDSGHEQPIAPNLLVQDFTAAAPNLGHRHHLHSHRRGLAVSGGHRRSLFTQGRWLGHATDHAPQTGAEGAQHGRRRSPPTAGLIHHSDRGHQSWEWRNPESDRKQSEGRQHGSHWENALSESPNDEDNEQAGVRSNDQVRRICRVICG